VNGFLVIDKNTGMTSFDVIRRLKKLHPFNKIGYIGTLDRNATGILPVALNDGVKLIPFLENGEKTYKAKFLLGVTTDTLDIEGKILSQVETQEFDRDLLEDKLHRFMGKITQQIPAYSSKKVNRKPLYKFARKGIAVAPQLKEVEIFNIKLLDYAHPYLDVEVSCSKGTYIRAMSQEFGSDLGCGSTLYSLKRTKHGEFTEDMAVNIEHFKIEQDVLNYVMSLEKVLKSLRETVVETALEKFLKNGMPIPLAGNSREWQNGEHTKLLNKKGSLIGIGMADTFSKTIKIKRLINV
jgi:tRNA pseudouridine55 synthase